MKTINALLLASCALLLVQAVMSGAAARKPVLVALVNQDNTDDEQECSPGDEKKEDCNSCFCAEGHWACTLMACPRERRDVDSTHGDECRDGYRKKVDCNDCACKNGYWACTRKACPAHLTKRAVPFCQPGETKQEECNRCSCANGQWACTRRFCPKFKREVSTKVLADLKNVPCTPNDSFLIDCNRCQCNFERTGYACTKFDCIQERALPSS